MNRGLPIPLPANQEIILSLRQRNQFGYDGLEMQNKNTTSDVSRNMRCTRHIFFLDLRRDIDYLSRRLNSLSGPASLGDGLQCLFVQDVGQGSTREPVTAWNAGLQLLLQPGWQASQEVERINCALSGSTIWWQVASSSARWQPVSLLVLHSQQIGSQTRFIVLRQ